MRVAVTAILTALLLIAHNARASPLFFSSPDDKSHIQNGIASKQIAGGEEEESVTQLLSEFSIVVVEFFLQIVGISVGAFNIIKDVVGEALQGASVQ